MRPDSGLVVRSGGGVRGGGGRRVGGGGGVVESIVGHYEAWICVIQ